MVAFFERLAPTVIAIEACGASHHWARLLQSFGHGVKMIAPQLVKPYVKRGKNDAADAEAVNGGVKPGHQGGAKPGPFGVDVKLDVLRPPGGDGQGFVAGADAAFRRR
jgi:hypothetical protein